MQNRIAHWGTGINLGNSLDAIGEETVWGNVPTTREIIHMFAASGMNILRVPVTWYPHMDKDCNVDPQRMERVHEVVTWAIEEGMRVILNTHHEQHGWLDVRLEAMKDMLPGYAHLWRQIAERFNHFGDQLIFQGLNEPRVENCENEWYGATPNIRAAINVLNHTFVDVVRSTGGNNATRWLCIPPAGAKPVPAGLNDLLIPEDDRIIVTVHSYTPANFVFAHNPEKSTLRFTDDAREALSQEFEVIRQFRERTGVPVMITEYGSVTKVDPLTGERNDADRVAYEQFFLGKAKEQGIPCVLWDNNYYDNGDEWFGLFDRRTLKCNTPAVLEAIQAFSAK